MENLYIVHTSGSTGSSKAVACTHEDLLAIGIINARDYKLTPKSILAVDRSSGVLILRRMYDALASGCNLAVYSGNEKESLRQFLIERNVTHFCTIATTFRWVCGGIYKFPNVELVEIGGEMCDWDDVALMRECFPNAVHMVRYAASEVHIITRGIIPHDRPLGHGNLPVGLPFEGVYIYLLDQNNKIITTPYMIGEIVVSAKHAAKGYWNDPELTALKFRPLGYYTGDLGYLQPDGWLMHCGRKDFRLDMVGQYAKVD